MDALLDGVRPSSSPARGGVLVTVTSKRVDKAESAVVMFDGGVAECAAGGAARLVCAVPRR